MASPSEYTNAVFHGSIIRASNRKPAEEHGLKHYVAVWLFIKVGGNTSRVCLTTLCRPAGYVTGTGQHQMLKHHLVQDDDRDLTTIRSAVILQRMESHTYSYTFYTRKEELSAIDDVSSAGV